MTKEQQCEITDSLVLFVKRVALDETASSAEIAVLPEVAKLLYEARYDLLHSL